MMMDHYAHRYQVDGLDFQNLLGNSERNMIMGDTDLRFPENLVVFTTEELRKRYKLISEELINRRDFIFDNLKTNL